MAITWKKIAFEADVITKAFMAAKGDLISASDNDTPLILTVGGTNGHVLTVDSGEATGLKWAAGGSGSTADSVKVSDTKAYDAGGGTFTQDAWRTRDINTEDSDASGICSISSNQITLAAGTYICQIKCPAYKVDKHFSKLQNITDGAIELRGTAEKAAALDTTSSSSVIVGKFTIAAQKIFEVQHFCGTTAATYGFGFYTNVASADSVYTVAEFWRVAT